MHIVINEFFLIFYLKVVKTSFFVLLSSYVTGQPQA